MGRDKFRNLQIFLLQLLPTHKRWQGWTTWC